MMHQTAAIATSCSSLCLVCAIYYCNILSRPGSWLRGEMLAMILLSLLVGLFPLAVAASLTSLSQALIGKVSLAGVLSLGSNLVSIGAILATITMFCALVRATYRRVQGPANMTPPSPRPISPRPESPPLKSAA